MPNLSPINKRLKWLLCGLLFCSGAGTPSTNPASSFILSLYSSNVAEHSIILIEIANFNETELLVWTKVEVTIKTPVDPHQASPLVEICPSDDAEAARLELILEIEESEQQLVGTIPQPAHWADSVKAEPRRSAFVKVVLPKGVSKSLDGASKATAVLRIKGVEIARSSRMLLKRGENR